MKCPSPVLEISNLRIRRGNTVILDNISWTVNPGQHWVILGANGSGKTSLLSTLLGYLTPSEGEIVLLGQRFGEADWRDLRQNIGIVSSSVRQMMADSEPALDTIASGKYAMIDFWGTPSRQDRAQARKILEQIECNYLGDRPWAYLSQGERQRVLIGRALMAKPAILILDEPCAGLDPVAREHFLQFVNRLGQNVKAPSLILVTHHVEEIQPPFSHVLLLKQGRILFCGKKQTGITSPWLSNAFDADVRIGRAKGMFTLSVSSRKSSIV